MDIYRALNFRNLIHMADADIGQRWDEAERDAQQNWWFSPKFRALKEEVIGHVISRGTEVIVNESLYFTSLRGGRWNLPKSHGVLYCSENPLLSCLEVAYHNLMDGVPHLRRLKAVEDRIAASINIRVPSELRFLIVVLVFELAEGGKSRILDDTSDAVKAACNEAGFRNYTRSPRFDEGFIRGNDYTVTQTIGAMLYGQKCGRIVVRSARLGQPMRLLLLTEHAFDMGTSPVRLKPLYYEFDCRVEPLSSSSCFELRVSAHGQGNSIDFPIHLERVPLRPSARSKAVRRYLPSNTRAPEKDGRVAMLQEYHLESSCPFRQP